MKQNVYSFKVYIVGSTSLSRKTIANLKNALEDNLKGKYEIEIIDILENTDRAAEDKIYATPTVIKVSPGPIKRAVGVLDDQEKILSQFGLLNKKKSNS